MGHAEDAAEVVLGLSWGKWGVYLYDNMICFAPAGSDTGERGCGLVALQRLPKWVEGGMAGGVFGSDRFCVFLSNAYARKEYLSVW